MKKNLHNNINNNNRSLLTTSAESFKHRFDPEAIKKHLAVKPTKVDPEFLYTVTQKIKKKPEKKTNYK